MKIITLTERQRWFMKCAIEAKDAILPLHKNSLDEKIFEKDYGISKEEVEIEIASLKRKLQ